MPKYKIELDRENCIGCASCPALCPANWMMNDDGKSNFKKEDIGENELECNKQAAESCPVNVIHIFEYDEQKKAKGKKLI